MKTQSISMQAASFRAAREATGPEPVSLWQLLRGYRVADPLEHWRQLREEYGAVARYRFGLDDSYFISHPDGARHVLQDNASNYTKEHSAYTVLRGLFGNGLFTSGGAFWLKQRRLAQPAFHRERIAAMGAQMTAAAVRLAEEWEARLSTEPEVSMLQEMSRLALRVVGDALFGTGLSEKTARVAKAWEVLNTQSVERFNKRRILPPLLPTRSDRGFRRARRELFSVVDEVIAQKQAEGGGSTDLLSLLLSAKDEDTGEQMTDAQLRDEVITLLLAGHETTAVALSWTWALLAEHPAARATLAEELDTQLNGRTPTAEDVPNLPFTRAVVDESMRLYPPAYIFFRRAKEDDVVCGCRIHRGGAIVISPLALHRNPSLWEQPDRFWPERWLQPSAKERPRFAFLPFSGGPRQCIGNHFAVMEAVLVLATLAQRFAPTLKTWPEPEYLVTLRPAGGLPMHLCKAPAASSGLRGH
jgi:cytochrome P450